MSRIDGYSIYGESFQKSIYNNPMPDKRRAETSKTEKAEDAVRISSKQPELSQGAKDLLNEMQKKYGDIDFFVADYSSDEEAQRYLSRGNKDYSVLIEPELLEKMAADESVKEKYLGVIDDAKNKISEAIEEIAKMYDSAESGKKSDIKSIGFSVKSDGSVSFFAELEKSSADQQKRIEESREEKRAKKKEEEKEAKAKKLDEQREARFKKGLVKADSIDELVKGIQGFDWDSASEEVRPKAGGRLDVRM